MKRLISIEDCKYYSHFLKLIESFNLNDEYKWLLTDVEAYPKDRILDVKLAYSDCIICSNKELLEWLRKDDFQWIWGVLSLFKSEVSEKEILEHELPGIGDEHPRPHLFDDNKPIIQHPLAVLELDAFDSTFLTISSKEDKFIEIFKRLYPKSRPNL